MSRMAYWYEVKGGGIYIPKGKLMEEMLYNDTLDLMDTSVFPAESFYAQPENSADEEEAWLPNTMSNEEIIDFVVDEMKDTLG